MFLPLNPRGIRDMFAVLLLFPYDPIVWHKMCFFNLELTFSLCCYRPSSLLSMVCFPHLVRFTCMLSSLTFISLPPLFCFFGPLPVRKSPLQIEN